MMSRFLQRTRPQLLLTLLIWCLSVVIFVNGLVQPRMSVPSEETLCRLPQQQHRVGVTTNLYMSTKFEPVPSCSFYFPSKIILNRLHRYQRRVASAQTRLSLHGHDSTTNKNDIQRKQQNHTATKASSWSVFTGSSAEQNLLQHATSHFTSQALHTFVQLRVADVFDDTDDINDADDVNSSEPGSSSLSETLLTIDEIVNRLQEQRTRGSMNENKVDTLYRILRLLTTIDIVYQRVGLRQYHEDVDSTSLKPKSYNRKVVTFGLTETGKLLRTSAATSLSSRGGSASLAPFILHWMEDSIWDAFEELPKYMMLENDDDDDETMYPFNMAHFGVSAGEYYSNKNAIHNSSSSSSISNSTISSSTEAATKEQSRSTESSSSLSFRGQVAQMVSHSEIPAIVQMIDWSSFVNQTIVDIGGGYGDLMIAIANSTKASNTNLSCMCLDLAEVVHNSEAQEASVNTDVELIAGNMFQAETIPSCDAIVTKHVLCDWSDDDVIRMLQSCHAALRSDGGGGKVFIIDAVLHDGPDASEWQIQTSIDVLLMLTGRHMDRSASQWDYLASESGFQVDDIVSCPTSPSLNITILSKI